MSLFDLFLLGNKHCFNLKNFGDKNVHNFKLNVSGTTVFTKLHIRNYGENIIWSTVYQIFQPPHFTTKTFVQLMEMLKQTFNLKIFERLTPDCSKSLFISLLQSLIC